METGRELGHKEPGKSYRGGITLLELATRFPDEARAVRWFESIMWPSGEPHCGHCGDLDVRKVKNGRPLPYFCRGCKRYFSIRTGTVMQGSKLPVLKWVYAIYLDCTSLKGVSSMKLHRDLGVTQKTAWFMQQRIRNHTELQRLRGIYVPVDNAPVPIGTAASIVETDGQSSHMRTRGW
ncbi:MAG: hypothetical protein OYK82_09185 [Gammaproteobacteria bacterium]|nr:hypothetical protein [Gammaproteobacteria bacterium]